jgi:hypothetical protein
MLGLKKRLYGWLIAFSFAVYVFYDVCRFFNVTVCPNKLAIAFSLASVSILVAMIMIYREK